MKLNGAEITVKLLEKRGVEIIAGIPGGANLPIYNALSSSNIKHILTRHEQAAGFIAQGIARSTGKAAVCMATSGPGVTNLITAIADAKLDSIPIVAITGQVAYSLVGTDAFQEVDAYGLTLPIIKHNFLVRSARELFEVIPKAFMIAESGRPGPVHIDIPKDVQLEVIEFEDFPEYSFPKEEYKRNQFEILNAADMINRSKKPVILIGGGALQSDAMELITEMARKNSIPVASTLMGLGCFPTEDPLSLGLIGMHGARYTNLLLHESDLLIALGVRFDERAAGNAARFCENASIIHIDIDSAEINKIKQAQLSIHGDIKEILIKLKGFVKENKRQQWGETVEEMKKEYPFVMPEREKVFHPINIIKRISELASDTAIVTTDVGQHQMWTAQIYPFKYPRALLTSGGLGTMGFGLPAAIGAALANPEKQVICISGDGSILMNLQELATLADHQLNVKIFIMNNGHLGLVRQLQELFYKKNYFSVKFISNPDFAKIGEGFGITSYNLDCEENIDTLLGKVLAEPGPFLINVPVDFNENVLPIVPPGAANYEMLGE